MNGTADLPPIEELKERVKVHSSQVTRRAKSSFMVDLAPPIDDYFPLFKSIGRNLFETVAWVVFGSDITELGAKKWPLLKVASVIFQVYWEKKN